MKTLMEKLEDYYVRTSMLEPKPEVSFVSDEELFNKMADFITELNPDILDDNQLEAIIDIINNLEVETDDMKEAKMANKSLASKKTYGRQYYRKNKSRVTRQKKKIQKSAEGRKREKAEERMRSGNKTPTGRPLRKYHTDDHTN